MGWTKHRDAILTHVRRLREVRAELRSLKRSNDAVYIMSLLKEHERLSSALSYGRRDGVIASELGIHINYQEKDLTPVIELVLDQVDNLTFRRRNAEESLGFGQAHTNYRSESKRRRQAQGKARALRPRRD